MAVADVDTKTEVGIMWRAGAFGSATGDPDAALSSPPIANPAGYSEGTYIEMLPGSAGFRPKHDPIIRARAQTDRQHSPRARIGRHAPPGDFRTLALAGDTQLGVGTSPDGGPYSHLLDMAFGDPLTPAAYTTCTAGTSGTSFTVTDATSFVAGMLIDVEDITAPGATFRATRMIISVTTTIAPAATIVVHRALGFTPAATDIVRPLMTWVPHQNPFDHPVGYWKQISRNAAPMDGMLYDFANIGLTMQFEAGAISEEAKFHFTGMADSYIKRAVQNPDFTSNLLNERPPLLVGSNVFLGTGATAREVASVTVDPRISLAARDAISGDQGRSGWTHFANIDGPLYVIETLYDQDRMDDQANETLAPFELQYGANSLGTVAATSHSYFAMVSPAVQLVDVEPVSRGGLLYQRCTYEAKRSETVAWQNLFPFYFGIPGRVA